MIFHTRHLSTMLDVEHTTSLRNVAVIAHVDHGKTTLVDQLLRVTSDGSGSTTMDSGALEQERGITITSKATRLYYDDNVMNLVDTPGHGDFAGEVDRVLSMVQGVVLVVDAAEGPMPQTQYVLQRALYHQLSPIMVLNKCDSDRSLQKLDSGETEERLQQLMQQLTGDAIDMCIDYPVLYASARNGWITWDPLEAMEYAENDNVEKSNMTVLLDAILEHVPSPEVYDTEQRFSMAVTNVGRDTFLGRTVTGKVETGSVQVHDPLVVVNQKKTARSYVSGVFVYQGTERVLLEQIASAGDIVTLAGVPDAVQVGDTLTNAMDPVDVPIDTPPLAPPTLSVEFGANKGPLAGREGTQIASSKIYDRLLLETDNNVTLQIHKSERDAEKTILFARGELQLGILIEQMRREGFELLVSPPNVVTQTTETGETLEPFEEVTIDVDSDYAGAVVSAMTGDRKGVLINMEEGRSGDHKTRLIFHVPSRGLLGFNSEVATLTRGSAVMTHLFLEDRPYAGTLGLGLGKSKLVSNTSGRATAYALDALAARGTLFIDPGDDVYSGMVIGEHSRTDSPDLEVNPVKGKELTNMRTQSKDEKVQLPPPKRLSVEELIGYMGEDEMIEVTPRSIRLRKQVLDSGARERASRQKAKQMRASREKK